MKSTFKRLFSIMLVAMLLVTAIPFAASADTIYPIHYAVAMHDSAGTFVESKYAQNVDVYRAEDGLTQEQVLDAVKKAAKPSAATIAKTVAADLTNYTYDSTVSTMVDANGIYFCINAKEKPAVKTENMQVAAKIFVDDIDTGVTVEVTLRKTTKTVGSGEGATESSTYEALNAPDASNIQKMLPAEYQNKKITFKYSFDSGNGTVSYRGTTTATETGNVLQGGVIVPDNTQSGTTSGTSNVPQNDNTVTVIPGATVTPSNGQLSSGAVVPGNMEITVNGTNGTTTNGTTNGNTELVIPGSANPVDKVSQKQYRVKIHFYMNDNPSTCVKTVDITDTYGIGKYIDIGAAEVLAKNYFNCSNSLGITVDGYYVMVGSWAGTWVNDIERSTNVWIPDEAHRTADIDLMVMLRGSRGGVVSLKTSSASKADTSNPKTGDSIMVSVAALGFSASALAAAYYVSKKRKAI